MSDGDGSCSTGQVTLKDVLSSKNGSPGFTCFHFPHSALSSITVEEKQDQRTKNHVLPHKLLTFAPVRGGGSLPGDYSQFSV